MHNLAALLTILQDDLNNEPSTSEMSRVETPQTYHHRNLNGRFTKTSDDSTKSHGTNFDIKSTFSNSCQQVIKDRSFITPQGGEVVFEGA